MTDYYLIRKGGLYYRPKRCGYTADINDAGRYAREEAEREARIEPWHMEAIPEPENCPHRLARELRDILSGLVETAKENRQRLPITVTHAMRDRIDRLCAALHADDGTSAAEPPRDRNPGPLIERDDRPVEF